jgi:hypothetical protein
MNDDHDLLGAYALGALGHQDAARFLDHLSACSLCEAELWQASIAVEALAMADLPLREHESLRSSELFQKPHPNHPL